MTTDVFDRNELISLESLDVNYAVYDDYEDESNILIDKYFSFLNSREQYILTKHYGLDCEPMSITAIANMMERSVERIRQIKMIALRKIQIAIAKENRPAW